MSACLPNMPKKSTAWFLSHPGTPFLSCLGARDIAALLPAMPAAKPGPGQHTLQHIPVSRRMMYAQDSSPKTPALRTRLPGTGALCQHLGSKPQQEPPSSTARLGKSFCRPKQYLFTQRDPLNRAESLVTLPGLVLFLHCMYWGKLLPTQTYPC